MVAINGMHFEITSGVLLLMTDTAAEDEFTVLSLSNPSAWPPGLPTFAGPTLSLTFRQQPALVPPLALLSSDAPPPSLAFVDVPYDAFGLIAARNPSDVFQYSIEYQVDSVPEPPIGVLGVVIGALWWCRQSPRSSAPPPLASRERIRSR
jgi:hypothetical protein